MDAKMAPIGGHHPPAAAIVRATVVSTVGTIDLFLTAPRGTREDYVQSCRGKALGGPSGAAANSGELPSAMSETNA